MKGTIMAQREVKTMKVVVIGGSGLIGGYLVDGLKEFHHKVTVFDVKEPKGKSDVTFVKGDMLKIDDCRKALKEAEVIVHLAAIPNPYNDPPEKIMEANVMGTTNVYIVASELGVKRVIHASTDSAYGFWYKKQDFLPYYLPLDEDHPLNTQDFYGLSKKIDEEIAANFSRAYNMQTISVRIPFVAAPGKIAAFMTNYNISSYKGLMENPEVLKDGFWAYCDVRDVAQAFRLTVEAKDLKKHEVFCFSAESNATKINSVELVRKYWSEKIPFRKEIKGRMSLMDYGKAKAMLGYRPRYTLGDIAED